MIVIGARIDKAWITDEAVGAAGNQAGGGDGVTEEELVALADRANCIADANGVTGNAGVGAVDCASTYANGGPVAQRRDPRKSPFTLDQQLPMTSRIVEWVVNLLAWSDKRTTTFPRLGKRRGRCHITGLRVW